MQHYFLKGTEASSHITLFFTGWGMDEQPFKELKCRHDIQIFYDYRDLDIDLSHLKDYESVDVVSFSMGVWAGAKVMQTALEKGDITECQIRKSIALNGTPRLIDDFMGIPGIIYDGTMDRLTPQSLRKFNLRICGGNDAFKAYMECPSRRTDMDELREELFAMKSHFLEFSEPDFHWQEAYVADRDMIFSSENQLRFWNGKEVSVHTFSGAHYAPSLIIRLICQEELPA